MNFTARLWADRLVNGIDPHLRVRLATEPLATLVETGYRVEASSGLDQRRGAKGWCDGLSFFENGTILYVHTPYSDRENFTVLHRFAGALYGNSDWTFATSSSQLTRIYDPASDLEIYYLLNAKGQVSYVNSPLVSTVPQLLEAAKKLA